MISSKNNPFKVVYVDPYGGLFLDSKKEKLIRSWIGVFIGCEIVVNGDLKKVKISKPMMLRHLKGVIAPLK